MFSKLHPIYDLEVLTLENESCYLECSPFWKRDYTWPDLMKWPTLDLTFALDLFRNQMKQDHTRLCWPPHLKFDASVEFLFSNLQVYDHMHRYFLIPQNPDESYQNGSIYWMKISSISFPFKDKGNPGNRFNYFHAFQNQMRISWIFQTMQDMESFLSIFFYQSSTLLR